MEQSFEEIAEAYVRGEMSPVEFARRTYNMQPAIHGEQIKVGYVTRDGRNATAYIDEVTGYGHNKHSDIPVILAWSDEPPHAPHWEQVDTWEWKWGGDTFVRDDGPDVPNHG
jgi:hypothetical protein